MKNVINYFREHIKFRNVETYHYQNLLEYYYLTQTINGQAMFPAYKLYNIVP
jgi:hypothetical protein